MTASSQSRREPALTPVGPQSIHDDRLLSATLIAVCDDLARDDTLPLGRAASALIPPSIPLPPPLLAILT